MTAPAAARLAGIDYLRAVFSVAVIAVHLGYVFPSAIFDRDRYTEHRFGWSDLLNFYGLCLAVPVFVLISTYLYARKPTDSAGLGRRLWRIGRLLIFWSVALQIYWRGGIGAVRHLPDDARGLVLYVLTAGNTYYYFFLDLILATLVTHQATRMPTRDVWVLFALSTATVAALPLAHRATHAAMLGHHADPLNYLPYAFAGVGLARMTAAGNDRAISRIGAASLALAGLAAVLDWTVYIDPVFFEINLFALPAYSRPSLVFLAIAVLVLALRGRWPENAVVRFMSRHSLAVYCLHPFFMDVKYPVIDALDLGPWGSVLVPWGAVLGLSYLASLVMPAFLRPELIR